LNITQAHTDKKAYGLNETVTISCVVQNETGVNISVDNTVANIMKPDGSIEWITLFEGLIGNYNGSFTNTSLFGTYNVTISANKITDTAKLCFEVLLDHDIAVTSMDAPSFSEADSTIIVNATISNIGLNDESEITVDFIVDGVRQSNTTIPRLKSRSYTNVSFQWTAPVGRHNITIYAEPVVNETIVWNNMLSKNITIANIWVPDTYPTIQQAVNNATAGDTIIVRDGTYTENVNLNKSLTIRSENGSHSTIVQAADSNHHVFEVTADYVNISGFTVKGKWQKAGIYLDSNVDNCNISNNKALYNYHGIYLYSSSNNTLTSNTANTNRYGIYLSSSSNNTLTNNTMSGNRYNFGVYGISLSDYTQFIDTSNTVEGKPIYYWIDQNDKVIPSDAGYVGVVNATNITVRDLTLTKNGEGVLFAYTKHSKIENVSANQNYYGIHLRDSGKQHACE